MALHFASYGGQFRTYMDKHSWQGWNVKVTEQPVQELFEPSQLVYLSPDATEVLQEVSSDKVYVIGGLVDRSTRKVGAAGGPTARCSTCCHAPLPPPCIVPAALLPLIAAAGDSALTKMPAVVLAARDSVTRHGAWPTHGPTAYPGAHPRAAQGRYERQRRLQHADDAPGAQTATRRPRMCTVPRYHGAAWRCLSSRTLPPPCLQTIKDWKQIVDQCVPTRLYGDRSETIKRKRVSKARFSKTWSTASRSDDSRSMSVSSGGAGASASGTGGAPAAPATVTEQAGAASGSSAAGQAQVASATSAPAAASAEPAAAPAAAVDGTA